MGNSNQKDLIRSLSNETKGLNQINTNKIITNYLNFFKNQINLKLNTTESIKETYLIQSSIIFNCNNNNIIDESLKILNLILSNNSVLTINLNISSSITIPSIMNDEDTKNKEYSYSQCLYIDNYLHKENKVNPLKNILDLMEYKLKKITSYNESSDSDSNDNSLKNTDFKGKFKFYSR